VAKVFNVWDAFVKMGKVNPPYFPSVNKIEQLFDEYEQLLATCLHYSLRIGINGCFIGSETLFNLITDFEQSHSLGPWSLCRKEILSKNSVFKIKSYRSSCLPKLTGHRAVVTSDQTILTFGGSGENSKRMKHLISSKIDFDGKNNSEIVPDLILYQPEENFDDDVWATTSNELQGDTKILSENVKFYERLHASVVFIPQTVKEGEIVDSAVIFGGRKSPAHPCTNDLIELNLENLTQGEIGSVILSSAYGKCPSPRWRHSMALCSKAGSAVVILFGGRDTEVS
jgi:hypothetical protein